MGIGFRTTSKKLPSGILPSLASIFVGKDAVSKDEELSGIVTNRIDKDASEPLPLNILAQLRDIMSNIAARDFEEGAKKIEKLRSNINSIYGIGSKEQEYHSTISVLRLLEVHILYLSNKQIADNFAGWLARTRPLATSYGYNMLYVNNLYDDQLVINKDSKTSGAAVKIAPSGLDNLLVTELIRLQIKFHEGLNYQILDLGKVSPEESMEKFNRLKSDVIIEYSLSRENYSE